MMMIAVVLTIGIGMSLALLGGGGSTLTVPILVYVAGVAPATAVGMSLAIVAATSAIAAFLHSRSGNVDLRVAVPFAATGTLAALVGSRLTHLVTPDALTLSFAALLVVVGGWMISGVGLRAAAHAGRRRPGRVAAAGAIVGLLTGFLGVGGGFLVVPALVLFAGLTLPRAVGTSLLVIAANSTAGFVGHLSEGALPLAATLGLAAAASAGALVGYAVSRRITPERLRRAFAYLVIAVGGAVAVGTLA